MNLAPIIEQLRDVVPALRLVGGAAQFERALAGLATLPAAFVLPAKETALESAFMDQLVQQDVAAEFAVVLAVRNLGDDEGAAAVESLEPIRVAVRDALLSWSPADGYYGCEFATGSLLAFDNGVLWWEDTYRTGYVIRSS